MGGGRLLFFLLFFVAPLAECADKDSNKYYKTYPIPQQKWVDAEDGEKLPTPYKHEMVTSGASRIHILPGSNYSVHPTRNCDQKIGIVLQLGPESVNMADRANKMCTISITIDDGHVEVWYGLCLAYKPHTERKFDFSISPMALVYFTFDKLAMRVYRRESDAERDFEMGRVEHIPDDKEIVEWKKFTIFSYHDACKHVALKQVYDENDWRRFVAKKEDETPPPAVALARMAAIFSVPLAIGCLVLSLMHVWSMGIKFPTNGIFDAIFSRYNAKTGAIATPDKEEQKSCRSAEEPSEEWEGTGKKENLFCDRGRRKALVRPPPAYILPDYDAPYEDDPEPALATAIEEVDAPPIGSKEKADPFAAEAAAAAAAATPAAVDV